MNDQEDGEAKSIDVDEVIVPERTSERTGKGFQRRKGDEQGKPATGAGNRPGGHAKRLEVPKSPLTKLLSYILDECITIPGTKIRIGLDPILGLIPGGGEAVASVAGAFIIGEAYRKGVSLKIVFQMAGNLLLNAGVGAIPGIGDAFSVFFKSNSRNYRILDDFLQNPPPTGKRRRVWPIVLVLGLAAVAINITVWMIAYQLLRPVWDALFSAN